MTTIDLSSATTVTGVSTGLSAYVATPTTPGPWPGVVVIHEVFGPNEVMKRQVDRLAAAGYLAIMPDLFSQGGAIRCLKATFAALSAGTGRAFQDIEAARSWLVDSSDCTGRVGIIGFCLGGAFALVSTHNGFDASAPNYGFLPKDLDKALEGGCPVVASYGGKDRALKGAAATLEDSLTRVGVTHDVKEYPDAGHCFLNDAPAGPLVLRPLMKVAGIGPRPAAAADAWKRIESFFAEHLGADKNPPRDS